MGVNIDLTEAASCVYNDVVYRNQLISVLYQPDLRRSLSFLGFISQNGIVLTKMSCRASPTIVSGCFCRSFFVFFQSPPGEAIVSELVSMHLLYIV